MVAIQPLAPQGARLHWEQAPQRLREAFEAWAGSPVAEAVTQPSGFSPGVAARLVLENGRRVFVKAVGPDINPDSAGIHRREIAVISGMPEDVSAPRLLWSLDEGEGGWVALAFEDIEGEHPRQPWDLRQLDRILDALVRLGDRLTPSPLLPEAAPRASASFPQTCWTILRDEKGHRRRALAPWFRQNLDRLADLEAKIPEAVEGDTLVHFDIRADNILLTDDRVWFLDWPHACVGAAWVDVVVMAPSVTMQGGPPPEEIVAAHPAWRAADPDDVTAVVAALAGAFTEWGSRLPPPGLPNLRAFQQAQGAVARDWLLRRLS
ncbi:MAG: aminoglycoside phosphotransferase family protein [Dehalococcoidia bacterium]|nr:aminoglycoside phosphotransferase family protein [Dehalococcoidia bacterium]